MRAIKSSVKNKKQNSGISKAVIYFDGVLKLSRTLKTDPSNVSKWLYGDQPIPIKHAIQIECLTNGEITARELRPDVFKKILT